MKVTSIKNLRQHLALTQDQFGSLLEIGRGAVANYERKIRHPRLDIAYKIIDIAAKNGLKISMEDIYPRNS